MPQRPCLALNLLVLQGDEPGCARFLRSQMTAEQWAILAAVAAEVVMIHESASQGATTVLVVPEAAAKDLLHRL